MIVVLLTSEIDRPDAPSGTKWAEWDFAATEAAPFGKVTFHFTPPPPSSPDVTPVPKLQEFRLAMLSDSAYTALAIAYPGHAARVENAIYHDPPNWPIVAALWNLLIDVAGTQAEATSHWQSIANQNNIPLTFTGEGRLV